MGKGKDMLEINNRNRTIDFLKFIFAFIIAVYHGTNKLSGGKNQYFQNGRLGVEIYFLFTGYLMVVSFTKCKDIENIGRETFLFLKRKILRLFPNVYIAWLISFSLVHIFTQRKDIMKICLDFIKALPELLLISHSGISWKHYNIPMWYLSVMLISVTIIFPLMLKYKDVFFYIIAPIVFLALMGYLFQTYGEMSTPFIWTGYAYKGMLRGFAGIVGGVFAIKYQTG